MVEATERVADVTTVAVRRGHIDVAKAEATCGVRIIRATRPVEGADAGVAQGAI